MVALLTFSFNVQAETRFAGYINNIDLEHNIIEINNIEYQFQRDKIRIIWGPHILKVTKLVEGSIVDFIIEGDHLISIRLTTPPINAM